MFVSRDKDPVWGEKGLIAENLPCGYTGRSFIGALCQVFASIATNGQASSQRLCKSCWVPTDGPQVR